MLAGRVARVLEQVENCDAAVMAEMRKWFFVQSLRTKGRRAEVCFVASKLIDNFVRNVKSSKKMNREQIKAALSEQMC